MSMTDDNCPKHPICYSAKAIGPAELNSYHRLVMEAGHSRIHIHEANVAFCRYCHFKIAIFSSPASMPLVDSVQINLKSQEQNHRALTSSLI
eukprot:scaffold257179_cov19-Prasinocladus_malaysianus.AAC.1